MLKKRNQYNKFASNSFYKRNRSDKNNARNVAYSYVCIMAIHARKMLKSQKTNIIIDMVGEVSRFVESGLTLKHFLKTWELDLLVIP